MAFPPMPGYDHIDIVAEHDLDPIAQVKDKEIRERIRTYPKIYTAGAPEFGFAVQTGEEWRIGAAGCGDPAGARYDLARHLRMAAAERPADDRDTRKMRLVADRLDPEEGEQLDLDEWPIGARRFRIIRIEKFGLLGGGTMEPARVTDEDPPEDRRYLQNHLIDPRAKVGRWEAQIRLNMVGFLPPSGTPAEIVEEARRSILAHPGVVLLPPTFTVMEITGTMWEPMTGGEGPGQARDHLAGYFSDVLPRLREFQGDPPSAAERAGWKEAAALIRDMVGPDFRVLDRYFRVVRVGRLLRLGRDGPEGPRPHDQERYG